MSSIRQQLNQREIDAVLSRYELGAVRAINELAEGSVYSPKVIVETDRGKLLLKRRARGLDIPSLVAFSHEVINGCVTQGVCVPPLLGTKLDHNSMVQFEDHVYELFVFIAGVPFDRSPLMIAHHAQESGMLLAKLHTALDTIKTQFEPATESTPIDLARLSMLDQSSSSLDVSAREHLKRILGYGHELAKANASRQALVHGDWHPGNLIYRDRFVVGACDFDNTRVGSRLREVAQAMVHCSLKVPSAGQTASAADPSPDLIALKSFWNGYATHAPHTINARNCVGLMSAVMIDEALASSAADPTLVAIARKAIWIDEQQSELISILEQPN